MPSSPGLEGWGRLPQTSGMWYGCGQLVWPAAGRATVSCRLPARGRDGARRATHLTGRKHRWQT